MHFLTTTLPPHTHNHNTMKSITISFFICILASTDWQSSSGFAIPSITVQRSSSLNALHNDSTSCDRLTFLATIATAAVSSPIVAFADGGFEDLSMPSADEQKAENVSPSITRVTIILCAGGRRQPLNLDYSQDNLNLPISCKLGMAIAVKGKNMQCMRWTEKFSLHGNIVAEFGFLLR